MALISASTLGILLSASAFLSVPVQPVPHQISLQEWAVEQGDHLVADTKENTGFLIHPDGRYISFPIVTGRRSHVCYIGRCYNATTPARQWVVQSRHIKGDHITFGPSGRFLRLYHQGEQTAYGIHEYAYEEQMFGDEIRFKSMG
ncbi:MAG: hypothetical protein PHI23_03155, partial [Candidatus Peribacteraceae bacterium]|nr:hypothetical protein [Candidatus Peribacteraceae bacterium]